MDEATKRKKRILFVDDDRQFLEVIREVFTRLSGGSWIVHTADNHAQALKFIQRERPEIIVLDVQMPVMDGLQFLRLLGQSYPGQTVVMWTGHATDENHKACLEAGASLYLEKVLRPEGYAAVYGALDALANAINTEGFRGMMRRVGLQEVLQLECLGRKSSVLEVFTSKMRGRIYVSEGAIVHAEAGSLEGEVALYGLLGLRGGEFNLKTFVEPPRRSIDGHYEFLLMEAARLSDEAAESTEPETGEAQKPEDEMPGRLRSAWPLPPGRTRVEQFALFSGSGELLYSQGCQTLDTPVAVLAQIAHHGAQLAGVLRSGPLDRVEMHFPDGRVICRVMPDLRLFVRSLLEPPPKP